VKSDANYFGTASASVAKNAHGWSTRIQSLDVTRLADAVTGFNAFDPIGLKQIEPVGKTSRFSTVHGHVPVGKRDEFLINFMRFTAGSDVWIWFGAAATSSTVADDVFRQTGAGAGGGFHCDYSQ